MRAEIRCCCDPSMLLGTVDVNVDYLYEGQKLTFIVRPRWRIRAAYQREQNPDLPVVEWEPSELIELPVGHVSGYDRWTGEYLRGLAIKSMETPIEKLRAIKGFQEAR